MDYAESIGQHPRSVGRNQAVWIVVGCVSRWREQVEQVSVTDWDAEDITAAFEEVLDGAGEKRESMSTAEVGQYLLDHEGDVVHALRNRADEGELVSHTRN